jgi:hypothetical protein
LLPGEASHRYTASARLLPLLRPLQVDVHRRAALRAFAGLGGFHRLRFLEWHVELVGLILIESALALDALFSMREIKTFQSRYRRNK